MSFNYSDHPDITHCMKYGYPERISHIYCEECEDCLDDKEVYEDSTHDYLCKDCLCRLHQIGW